MPAAGPRIPVAESLRAECKDPSGVDAVKTAGDLAAYSRRQKEALAVCDARRAALVGTIDAANQATAPPRPWWRFGGR
jgi:hypothetical protein